MGNKPPLWLEFTPLQAKRHLELLNRIFEMGSYDYVFPNQSDEKSADEIRLSLKSYVEK